MSRFTALAILALTSAVVAAPADAAAIRTVRVKVADVNLASAAGSAVLHQRITNAVRTVCDAPSGPYPLSEGRRYRDCAEKSYAGAMTQMNRLVELARHRQLASNTGDITVAN